MTQEIKIGVSGDTGGAERVVRVVEAAADDLADSLQRVDGAAKGVNQQLGVTADLARRIKVAQDIMSRETGRPISESDAGTFVHNFDRMRSRGGPAGLRPVRGFNDLEDWYLGHGGAYKRPQDAARHRKWVMSLGMQGTDDAREHGLPPSDEPEPEPPPPPPPPGAPPQPFGGGIRKAGSIALGVMKGGLALAGINSIMGMAGESVSQATDEEVTLDTAKRQMRDLSVSFGELQSRVEAAGAGLGVSFVELAHLTQAYAHEVGNLNGISGAADSVRTGSGFARAFGIDVGQSVQFMAVMRRLGVTGGGEGDTKLAMSISDALQKSGYTGKADEVLSAVADYSQQVGRMAMGTPNVTGYLSAMAGMMGPGAGRDPASIAAILGTANSAMMRGGAMGEASQNFSYMAIAAGIPGINPVSAQALEQGGLFGTTRSVFGGDSELGKYYKSHGLRIPELTDTTNLDRMTAMAKRSYSREWLISAMAGQFGLPLAQSAMLADHAYGGDLGASSRLAAKAGIDLTKLNPSGFQDLASLATKTGISEPDRIAQAKVIGERGQDPSAGAEARESNVKLKDLLTKVGEPLLAATNTIRDAITAIANMLVPGFSSQAARQSLADVAGKNNPALQALSTSPDMKARAGHMIAAENKLYGNLYLQGGHPNDYSWMQKYIDQNIGPPSGPQEKSLRAAALRTNWMVLKRWAGQMARSDIDLGLPYGTTMRQIYTESSLDPTAVSKAGARGLAQFMPKTWEAYAGKFRARYGRDPDINDGDDSIRMNRLLMADLLAGGRKRHPGNERAAEMAAYSAYDSGHFQSGAKEATNYQDKIVGGHLAPNVKVDVKVVDTSGMPHKTLKPVVAPKAAGMPHAPAMPAKSPMMADSYD